MELRGSQTKGPTEQKVDDDASERLHRQTIRVNKRRTNWTRQHWRLRGYENYIKKNKEKLITAAIDGIKNIMTNRKTTKTKKQEWEAKQLYGYFKWQTGEISLEHGHENETSSEKLNLFEQQHKTGPILLK